MYLTMVLTSLLPCCWRPATRGRGGRDGCGWNGVESTAASAVPAATEATSLQRALEGCAVAAVMWAGLSSSSATDPRFGWGWNGVFLEGILYILIFEEPFK